jgi:hypothetical protein
MLLLFEVAKVKSIDSEPLESSLSWFPYIIIHKILS